MQFICLSFHLYLFCCCSGLYNTIIYFVKACMAFPWLLSIGFTMTFSALFSKIWRLNRVFENAAAFRRVKVKERDVIMPFVVLMASNFTLLLLWTLLDPLKWHRTEPDQNYNSQGYCQADGDLWIVFFALIGSINFLALMLANIQAFFARKITTEFSESSYVMMTMVSLLQALIIGAPLLILVRENEVVVYFVWSALIFVVVMATLSLMFGPKMMLVRQRALDRAAGIDPSRNNTRYSSGVRNSSNQGNEMELHSHEHDQVIIEAVASGDGDITIVSGTF